MGHIQVHEGTEMYASHQLPVLRAPMSGTEQPPWHGLHVLKEKVHYYHLHNKTSCRQQVTCIWGSGFSGSKDTRHGLNEH